MNEIFIGDLFLKSSKLSMKELKKISIELLSEPKVLNYLAYMRSQDKVVEYTAEDL